MDIFSELRNRGITNYFSLMAGPLPPPSRIHGTAIRKKIAASLYLPKLTDRFVCELTDAAGGRRAGSPLPEANKKVIYYIKANIFGLIL